MSIEKTPQGAESLLGKAENLAQLVAYQAGAVVSRTIIDKKSGTLTLFAFDADQGLSEHTAPFDAFVQIIDGNAVITISGENFHLKQGEMIVMPAGQPHSLKALDKFKMMLVMIRS